MAKDAVNQNGYMRPSINENLVQMTGTAIHLYKVPGVDTLVLTIATSGSSTRTNYPKVVWYGDLANEVEATVAAGDRVSILGTVQTRRYEREGEKAIYRQSIVGRGITHAKSKIETAFGIKPDRNLHIEDINDVRLAGSVLHIFKVPDRDIAILTLRTFTNGHVNTPKITLFGRTAQYALEEIEVGFAVCVIGFVYTNKSEKEDGSAEYYEGVTCTSIAPAPSEIEAAYGVAQN